MDLNWGLARLREGKTWKAIKLKRMLKFCFVFQVHFFGWLPYRIQGSGCTVCIILDKIIGSEIRIRIFSGTLKKPTFLSNLSRCSNSCVFDLFITVNYSCWNCFAILGDWLQGPWSSCSSLWASTTGPPPHRIRTCSSGQRFLSLWGRQGTKCRMRHYCGIIAAFHLWLYTVLKISFMDLDVD